MLLAYIDPATGAMILQIVAAGVLTAGVYFRRIFIVPFSFMFRKDSSDDVDVGDDEADS